MIDASVALKWFFQDRNNDAECYLSQAILYGVDAGRKQHMQPPYFIAEVATVLTREKPDALNTPGATLITADMAYYRKAEGSGRILLLKDYTE